MAIGIIMCGAWKMEIAAPNSAMTKNGVAPGGMTKTRGKTRAWPRTPNAHVRCLPSLTASQPVGGIAMTWITTTISRKMATRSPKPQ